MKILAVITARKHSKRLINKNFRKIRGLSLTEYTVAQASLARDWGAVTDVVLSTDSAYLLEQSRKYNLIDLGLRPETLSGDQVKSVDVLEYIIQKLEESGQHYDAVMTLQPTSPLRDARDIARAVELFKERMADSLITAAAVPNATINGLYEKTETGFLPISQAHNSGQRHQTLNPIYLRNGAIFITRLSWLLEHHTVISTRPEVLEMPPERSVDVDDMTDLYRAEAFRNSQDNYCLQKCPTSNIPRLPNLSQALEAQRNSPLQLIWEDIFRLWLYGMAEGKSITAHLAWTERHVYFDGLAVLVDGECINTQLMEKADAMVKVPPDHRLEAYLEEKLEALTCNIPSCRLILPRAEGTGYVRY